MAQPKSSHRHYEEEVQSMNNEMERRMPMRVHRGLGGQHEHHHGLMVEEFRARFITSLFLSLPIFILSLPGADGSALPIRRDLFMWSFSTVIFAIGGWPFLRGLRDEVMELKIGMMTLVGVAISVSYIYSTMVVAGLKGPLFFWELVALIDIMLLGHWLETRAIVGASTLVRGLTELLPQHVHLLRPDTQIIVDVPVESIKPGNLIVIKPGERIPNDGRVAEGLSQVDESLITGESIPVIKRKNDPIIGGTLNREGTLTIEVEMVGEGTFLSQIIQSVNKALAAKSRAQDLANRVASWLTALALSFGLVTFAFWLIKGAQFVYALERMVTVMVVACPHALGLAIPLVIAASASLAAKKGLLIRDRVAFERAFRIKALVFDKTGTLTYGKFEVRAIKSFSKLSELEVLQLAASIENYSEHPVGRAIVTEALSRGIALKKADDYKLIEGRGVLAVIGNEQLLVVSPSYAETLGLAFDHTFLESSYRKGYTAVLVLRNNTSEGSAPELLGLLALGDRLRPEAYSVIRQIKEMQIKPILITGDKKEVAAAIAGALGIDEYYAEIFPNEKAELIKKLQKKGLTVGMVGDGINDAPSLVTADVGLAIGTGTDLAIESAGIILIRSDLTNVVYALQLSRSAFAKMVENLFWAIGYNVITLPVAAGLFVKYGLVLSPAIGASIMSVSTIVVAINARRLHVR